MDLTEFVYLTEGSTVTHNGQTWTVKDIYSRGTLVIANDEDAKRINFQDAEVESYD